jgi:hypothetical protein
VVIITLIFLIATQGQGVCADLHIIFYPRLHNIKLRSLSLAIQVRLFHIAKKN